MLFGLGSVFFLVYNGLMIGAVAGLVTAAGHGKNLLTFTCTHGAFELTAIVISATAGMVMGYALVDTGGRTRFGSLRARARDIAYLVLGAALMLLVAAGIEGFWSPSGVPRAVKWGARDRRVPAGDRLPDVRRPRGPGRGAAAGGGAAVNLLAARVVLRQRSLADTLDLALPFCLANKRPLGVLALVMLGADRGAARVPAHRQALAAGRRCGCLCAAAALLVEGVFTVALGELLFKPPAEARVRAFVRAVLPPARRALLFASSCARVLAGLHALLILRLARAAIFVPEAMLLEGATFGQGAGAQPRAGAQPAGRLPRDLAGDAAAARVRRDRDGPLLQRRGRLRAAARPPHRRAVRATAAPASPCWARCWRCRSPPACASSATSTCARARRAGTSSSGSSRSPSRAPWAEGARRDGGALLVLALARDGDRRRAPHAPAATPAAPRAPRPREAFPRKDVPPLVKQVFETDVPVLHAIRRTR